MARQPHPNLRLYEGSLAPGSYAQPRMRVEDVSSGEGSIAQSLGRLAGAVDQYAKVDHQNRLDDARIDVTRRMAVLRADAEELRRRASEDSPDGWRGLRDRFHQNLAERYQTETEDETLTPEARKMLDDQFYIYQQDMLSTVSGDERTGRNAWQSDTIRQAIDAGGNVLVTSPNQYEAVRMDALETLGEISDPNMRRDATEIMEESYARYAVSGLIQADPRAALEALRNPESDGAYERLTPAARGQAIDQAEAEIDRRRAIYASQIRDAMSLQSDMIELDMPVANPVSVDTVRGALGEPAARAWGMRLRVAEERSAMRSATVPQLLAAMNETPDTSNLEARAGQVARQRAAAEQLTAIQRDPMAYLIGGGMVPDTPNLEQAFTQAVQNPAVRGQGSWQSFLRTRAGAAATAANARGVPARVFTEDEANGIAGRLRTMTPTQQASVLGQMRAALGANNPLYDVALAQVTPGGGASRVAGQYINAPNGGNVIAGRILEGQALISGTAAPEGERRQQFTLPSERDMRRVWSNVVGTGPQSAYRGLPEADAADFAAFQALYASEAARGGRYDGRLNDAIARRAADQIANVTHWSGRPVLMPPGHNRDSFNAAVRQSYAGLAGRGGDLDGHQASDFDLAPLGSGVYRLQVGDVPALDKDGRQVFVSVRR